MRIQTWKLPHEFWDIRALGLKMVEEWEGIGWEWQRVDGSLVKAPLTLEAVGKSPTARGKKASREACGGPEQALVSDRDRRVQSAFKLLDETLSRMMVEPGPTIPQPNLCADAGYQGKEARQHVEEHGYIPRIHSRGKEKQDVEHGKHPRRWALTYR